MSGSGQMVAAAEMSCSFAFLISIVIELSNAPLDTSLTVVTPQKITSWLLPAIRISYSE